MKHPLDRPVWTALTTRHAMFAEGGPLAKRYTPSIVPFAACGGDDADSLHALEALVPLGESVLFAQADDIKLPAGLVPTITALGVQMISVARLPHEPDTRVQRLQDNDAAEMLALATLTKPGPFTLKAMSLGGFWGVKIDGKLAAMAGERMSQPGLSEISGVCSHPDARGLGLAKLLSLHVAEQIYARGDTPYLHAYATNSAAIRLYEAIGFTLRCNINVMMARRS